MNSERNTHKLSDESYISAPAYLDLYDLLSNRYIDDNEVNIDRKELLDIEKRIPISMEAQLWDLAKRYGAPAHIGIIAGSQINEEAKGVLSHLVSYSTDLNEALDMFSRYIRIMSDNEHIEIISIEGGKRIYFDSEHRAYGHISSLERSMAALLTWGRYLTGVNILPLCVSFQHSQPDYYPEYVSHFGDRCYFDRDRNYIDVSNKDLKLGVVTANDYIKSVLADRADKICDAIDTDFSLIKRVRIKIEKNLSTGYFSSSDIAEKLNMSRQTLHRRLKEYDTSFKVLLEDVRKDKALYHLKGSKVSLDEIGFKLGFKEGSAFYRAFKSWFGLTPGQYRKRLGANKRKLNPLED